MMFLKNNFLLTNSKSVIVFPRHGKAWKVLNVSVRSKKKTVPGPLDDTIHVPNSARQSHRQAHQLRRVFRCLHERHCLGCLVKRWVKHLTQHHSNVKHIRISRSSIIQNTNEGELTRNFNSNFKPTFYLCTVFFASHAHSQRVQLAAAGPLKTALYATEQVGQGEITPFFTILRSNHQVDCAQKIYS